MAFFTGFAEAIQNTRTSLEQNTIINDPENYQKPTGMLDFLFNSQLNTRTIDAIMRENGNREQYRPVDIRYNSHWGDGGDDLVTTDSSLTCDANDQRRDTIVTEQPDLFVSFKFTLDDDYLRENTEDFDSAESRMTRYMRNAQRVCRESMSSQVLSKVAGLFGSNPAAGINAGAYQSFQALNSNGGADVNNFDIMHNDQLLNFMTGPIGVISFGGNPLKYFNRLATGNLNTNAGVDIMAVSQQFGALNFLEHSSTANLGNANRVLAFYPGLTQFFSYNLNRGYFAKQVTDSYIKGTMPDAIYPFDWDFDLFFDRNCTRKGNTGLQGSWVVRIWLYFDVFNVPEAAFGDTYSDLNDFNGVVGYEMTAP